MASRCLNDIERDKNAIIERQKQKELEKFKASWWNKFLKKPDPTDEQLTALAFKNFGNQFYTLDLHLSVYREKQRKVAERLLQTSKYVDEISVSTEDFVHICEFDLKTVASPYRSNLESYYRNFHKECE